jgi:cyclopropane-fatty-acyl-phospholipid synthase
VSVLGITVSENQARHAREYCRGLDVEIRLEDYRRLEGRFDRVLSRGMFEHVGAKNYKRFMRIVRRHLADDGLFLLHTIGSTQTMTRTDPWTERYIFPNSVLPSVAQIGAAIEHKFVLEDWHSSGADYDTTLLHWYRNVEEHWPELQDQYDERFHRMWRFFLLSSAGGFRARKNQLWQIILSPHGVLGGYRVPSQTREVP